MELGYNCPAHDYIPQIFAEFMAQGMNNIGDR